MRRVRRRMDRIGMDSYAEYVDQLQVNAEEFVVLRGRQEAYSLAMLFADAIGVEAFRQRVKIHAVEVISGIEELREHAFSTSPVAQHVVIDDETTALIDRQAKVAFGLSDRRGRQAKVRLQCGALSAQDNTSQGALLVMEEAPG